MARYYNRKGEEVETWEATQTEGILDSLLEDTPILGVTVTTVFTGFNVGTDDDPKIFETLIHGGFHDGQRETYFLESDAVLGHKKWVQIASESLPSDVQTLGDMIADSGETNPYKVAKKLLETKGIEIKTMSDKDNRMIELENEISKLKQELANLRKSPHILVTEFHTTYNMPIRETPTLDIPARKMRLELILEEAQEYAEAESNGDLVEMADALADLVYVAYGAALEHGIDLDHVLQEVQRSNLSKLHHETGLPIYREDGKVLKGENFSPPDIDTVLKQQGWEG